MHTMEFPRKVILGSDNINDVPDVVKRMKFGSKVLIISGSRTYEVAGSKVESSLSNSGYEVDNFLLNDKSMEEVDSVVDKFSDFDWMIGVGGGSVIDVAKVSSYRLDVPFVSFPTTASHDGIASSKASIGSGKSQKTHSPLVVIVDTKIVSESPYRFTAAGVGDAVSNLTAVRDLELANRLRGEYKSDYASSLSRMSAEMIIKDADFIKDGLEESARKVIKALISSGVAMSIAGSSRPASGAEHMFSHALDEIADSSALHGEQCGVGSIIMAYLHGMDWERIKNTLKKVKAPTNAEELGVSREEIIKALTTAHKIRDRYTILGESGLTEKAAKHAAKTTKVIK